MYRTCVGGRKSAPDLVSGALFAVGEPSISLKISHGETYRWNGVINFTALKRMGNMKPGDLLFIYHTGKEKAFVG